MEFLALTLAFLLGALASLAIIGIVLYMAISGAVAELRDLEVKKPLPESAPGQFPASFGAWPDLQRPELAPGGGQAAAGEAQVTPPATSPATPPAERPISHPDAPGCTLCGATRRFFRKIMHKRAV